MENLDEFARIMQYELKSTQKRLLSVEKELEELATVTGTVVTKKIQGKPYYYEQKMEDGKLKCRSLGPVKPGSNWDMEAQILKKRHLQKEKKELESLYEMLNGICEKLKKRKKEKILPDFSFEVFWKDELTASVRVKGADVKVTRFTDHPLRQLFAAEKISRYQLNHILELRCFEKGRSDIEQILQRLGLTDYDPYEIVKQTHGVSYNDYIWLRFPGENLTARDVLVR